MMLDMQQYIKYSYAIAREKLNKNGSGIKGKCHAVIQHRRLRTNYLLWKSKRVSVIPRQFDSSNYGCQGWVIYHRAGVSTANWHKIRKYAN